MRAGYGSTLGALAAALGVGCGGAPNEAVTAVSWGGSYARAVTRGYIEPFMGETGIEVRLEDYNGGLAQVRAQVESGNVYWDVVDLEIADAVSGCDEGLLERIDVGALSPAPDGTLAADDFLPDTLLECSVGTLLYSTVYAYNEERTLGEKPATLEDFFDLDLKQACWLLGHRIGCKVSRIEVICAPRGRGRGLCAYRRGVFGGGEGPGWRVFWCPETPVPRVRAAPRIGARRPGRCYPKPVRSMAPQTLNSLSTEGCHPMIRRVVRRARRMTWQGMRIISRMNVLNSMAT